MATKKPQSAAIHSGVGFRIRTEFARPPREVISKFEEFESPDISDQMNRMYTVSPDIRCLSGERHPLVGPAFTVKVYPGDNLMVHKCLDIAQPDDVVVIDASGSTMNAVLGGMISMKAKSKRIAGFLIDGYIRDLAEVRRLDFPVFARGVTAVGPLHRGPGEINYPICCGGVVTNPGDIVVADQTGVVVLPQDHIDEIYQRLANFKQRNKEYIAGVKSGDFSNAWVDDVLSSAGLIPEKE